MFCINFDCIKFFVQSNLRQWRQIKFLVFNYTNKWSNFVWILNIEQLNIISISKFMNFSKINWIFKFFTSESWRWNEIMTFRNKKSFVFEFVATIIVKNFINWNEKWLFYVHNWKLLKLCYANNNITIRSFTIRMQKNNFENRTYYVSIFIFSNVQRIFHHFSSFFYFLFSNVFYYLFSHCIFSISNILTSMIFTTIKKMKTMKKQFDNQDMNMFCTIFYRTT